MADNKNKSGEPDRSLINTSERYEMDYWTKKLGVSDEELKRAVKAVGNSAEKVAVYLKNNK
ncbi:hypothetical protein FIC_01244 [Flavobacteriaceae bacterium 3519-10]|nr:hypothetical protein FIC_01244 [Flavobacteriaceae bacterium 3519-10]